MATSTMYFPGNVYPQGYDPAIDGYDYNPSLGELLDLNGAVVTGKTSTVQTLALQNGLVVKFIGTGFTYDPDGSVTGGTLTQVKLYLHNGTTAQQTLTGLNVSFEDFHQAAGTFGPWALNRWLMNGNDIVNGSAGDDDLYGHAGNDTLNGGAGDDYLVGGAGKDTYDGGAGLFDQLSFDDAYNDPTALHGITLNATTKTVTDPWGNAETFKNIEEFRGTQFADSFTGSALADTFMGLGGRDVINGGAGSDTVRYDRDDRHGGTAGVTVDLTAGYAIDGFGKRDTLTSIENVRATKAADTIIGNAAANQIIGGGGADTLTGKAGADTFVFRNNGEFGATITDFVSGTDHIDLWGGVSFSGATLQLYNGTTIGSQTTSTAAALFFNTANDTLYYDSNGKNAGGQTVIAHLTGVAALTHDDIWGIG